MIKTIFKKHWPLIIILILHLIFILGVFLNLTPQFLNKKQIPILMIIETIIIPTSFAIMGIWYGININYKKYFFIPLPFILSLLREFLLFRSFSFKEIDFSYHLFTISPLLIGLLLGEIIIQFKNIN